MTISGISPLTSYQQLTQQVAQSSGHHRHGNRPTSIGDFDAEGTDPASSPALAPSASPKVGSKVNVTA